MTAQAIAPVRTRAEWAEIINADWRRSIEGIIQTGRDLEAAAKELPGEFAAMVRDDLPFSIETADKLRRIARHPTISNPSSRTSFPPSWTVLHELSKLSERDFADAQSSGLISDATSRRKAAAIADAYRTPEGVAVGEGRSPNFLPTHWRRD